MPIWIGCRLASASRGREHEAVATGAARTRFGGHHGVLTGGGYRLGVARFVRVAARGVAAVAVVGGLATASAAARAHGGSAACRVPVGERQVAARGNVVVWETPAVQTSGGVYACSTGHPRRVTLLHVKMFCPSPTGCSDGWVYTQVRFAGPWVAASASIVNSAAQVGLWDATSSRGARVIATPVLDTYALKLRPDGAVAFAYQRVTNSFKTVDVVDACDGGCPGVRQVDRYVEPENYLGSKPLLTGLHFGARGYLLWRAAGHQHKIHLR